VKSINKGNHGVKNRFRFRSCLIALLLLCLPASALAQARSRIDPAGIGGALLLCGRGDISQPAVEKFFALAGGDNAKIVVLACGTSAQILPTYRLLRDQAEMKKIAPVRLLQLSEDKDPGYDFDQSLEKATGVWLVGTFDAPWRPMVKRFPVEKACLAVLKRAGAIGASGSGVELASREQLDDPKSDVPTLTLLPDSIIDVRNRALLEDAIKRHRNLAGYDIEPGAAMLVKGRTISSVGDKKITIYLGSENMPARAITVQGKQQADLTALRRALLDRAQAFPPAKLAPPVVENGTLVIVGGGGSPEGMHKKFVDYAGGPEKAKIVIFPTANPDPLKKREAVAEVFRKAGAKKATILYGRTLAEVESKEFLDTLKEATGLWFDGGRQWRFVDCYEDTEALPLMFDVLKRGGVIGGTSAGATIQGDYLCRGGVFHNFDIRYEGYERGLGFLKGVAIDQHFTQRKRQSDMTQLMKIYPQYLGIGLDEATAIVVKGSIAEVIGKGKAHFYDANRKVEKEQPDYEALSAGGRYDLKQRKIVSAEK